MNLDRNADDDPHFWSLLIIIKLWELIIIIQDLPQTLLLLLLLPVCCLVKNWIEFVEHGKYLRGKVESIFIIL